MSMLKIYDLSNSDSCLEGPLVQELSPQQMRTTRGGYAEVSFPADFPWGEQGAPGADMPQGMDELMQAALPQGRPVRQTERGTY